MEAPSHLLETRVFGRDQSVRGLLRATLAPTLGTHLFMPDFTDSSTGVDVVQGRLLTHRQRL
jgi:hypothetical protein